MPKDTLLRKTRPATIPTSISFSEPSRAASRDRRGWPRSKPEIHGEVVAGPHRYTGEGDVPGHRNLGNDRQGTVTSSHHEVVAPSVHQADSLVRRGRRQAAWSRSPSPRVTKLMLDGTAVAAAGRGRPGWAAHGAWPGGLIRQWRMSWANFLRPWSVGTLTQAQQGRRCADSPMCRRRGSPMADPGRCRHVAGIRYPDQSAKARRQRFSSQGGGMSRIPLIIAHASRNRCRAWGMRN